MNYTTSPIGGIKTYAQYIEEAKHHHYTSPEILSLHEIILKTEKAMSLAYPSVEEWSEQDEKRVTEYVKNRFEFYGEEGCNGSK